MWVAAECFIRRYPCRHDFLRPEAGVHVLDSPKTPDQQSCANHQKHSREMRGETQHFYAMPWEGRYIWGATAAMIRNLFERLTG